MVKIWGANIPKPTPKVIFFFFFFFEAAAANFVAEVALLKGAGDQ